MNEFQIDTSIVPSILFNVVKALVKIKLTRYRYNFLGNL
jgi:hypothetical protein